MIDIIDIIIYAQARGHQEIHPGQHTHIIDGLFTRKTRLDNQHLHIAVLTGHAEGWMKMQHYTLHLSPKCPKCGKF